MTGALLRSIAARAVKRPIARRAVEFALRQDPSLATEPLGQFFNRGSTLADAELPDAIDGFEDLASLFASSIFNHRIIDMGIDEAAYLYRLVRQLQPETIVEIGRFKGGGTLLIATAMPDAAELWSYDLHVKLTGVYAGEELDRELVDLLTRFGVASRVHIVVADSRTAAHPPRRSNLMIVDGDHSYEGVRADYLHWRGNVAHGGHMLFHDAAGTRAFAPRHADVVRLLDEVARDDGEYFVRTHEVGSLVDLVRTDVPAPFDAVVAG
jgi:predicted O-methyltransferase YrrM